MMQGLFNQGSLAVLEKLVGFTGQRHQLLVHNIANVSTPGFKPVDVSPRDFQAAMQQAIEQRRRSGDVMGALPAASSTGVALDQQGVHLQPRSTHEGILFHDQNNRDLERLMADLAENSLAHRVGIELMRSEFRTLETAIRGRL